MRGVAVIAAGAVLTMGAAPGPKPLPVNVGGRTIREAGGAAAFGWPSVYFESRFRGSAVRVRFEAPNDRMRLLVDGEEMLVFRRPGAVDLTLGRLSAGEHVVRLEKLTETQSGGGRFLGFYPAAGGVALPAPRRARQIEFIGDSYTVGYGDTSPSRVCTPAELNERTDSQQAFGPVLARRYDADYRVHAVSGIGVVRNYAGAAPGLNLPLLYGHLKPDAAAPAAAPDPGWRPQVIVVNLGTNDFSTPVKASEPWGGAEGLKRAYRERYVAFLTRLKAAQPQARIVLMGSDLFYSEVVQVAAAANATDAGRVATLKFAGLAYSGCDSHPSTADDQRLADQLQQVIDALGVWPAAR